MSWLTVSVIVALSVFVLAAAEETKCRSLKHYEEIGCTPVFKDNEKCPFSYNCDHLQKLDDNRCNFQGKSFSDESYPGTLPPCVPYAHCFHGSFMAGHIDCGHTFRLPNETCAEVRSGCCPVTHCGKELEKLHVCHAEGQSFYAGEKWNPKEDKCIKCTCDDKWDNSTSIYKNENCKPQECFEEFWHLQEYKKGCAPRYYGSDRCCPSDTKCPSTDDKLIKAAEPSSNTDLKCKFGELELQLGDGINDSNNCLDCKCLTPPLVECNWIEGCERNYN